MARKQGRIMKAFIYSFLAKGKQTNKQKLGHKKRKKNNSKTQTSKNPESRTCDEKEL